MLLKLALIAGGIYIAYKLIVSIGQGIFSFLTNESVKDVIYAILGIIILFNLISLHSNFSFRYILPILICIALIYIVSRFKDPNAWMYENIKERVNRTDYMSANYPPNRTKAAPEEMERRQHLKQLYNHLSVGEAMYTIHGTTIVEGDLEWGDSVYTINGPHVIGGDLKWGDTLYTIHNSYIYEGENIFADPLFYIDGQFVIDTRSGTTVYTISNQHILKGHFPYFTRQA